MKENKHTEEWKEEAPKLASLKPKQPFEAPEGYFDSLPSRIMQKINAAEGEKSQAPRKRKSVLFWLMPASGIAASLLIILGIFLKGNPEVTPIDITSLFPSDVGKLSDEQLLAVVENEEIPEYQIVASLGNSVLPEVNQEKKVEKELDEVSTEDLRDYLQDIPLEELENML